MKKEITRAAYMRGDISHDEYYSAIVKSAGIDLRDSYIMDDVRKSKNAHLNDISLGTWDLMALSNKDVISDALKKHGDSWSKAGGVCVMKRAAIVALNH